MLQNQGMPVCMVAGSGPSNGMAYARRFCKAGYKTVLLARNVSRL